VGRRSCRSSRDAPPWIVPAHVVAGGLALVFGYIALYAAKGASLHRKSGILFVYAMLTMSLTGALMDALITTRMSVSVVAGLVTFYFVTTALLTVRPRLEMSAWIDAAAMVFGLTVGPPHEWNGLRHRCAHDGGDRHARLRSRGAGAGNKHPVAVHIRQID
jgi:uncharacterized membrane protein